MSNRILVVFISLIMLCGIGVHEVCAQEQPPPLIPRHLIYGTASFDGQVLTQSDTGYTIHARVDQLLLIFLYSSDSQVLIGNIATGLDSGTTTSLQQAFADSEYCQAHGTTLSGGAAATPVTVGSEWTVTDADKTYTVKLDDWSDGNRLEVYEHDGEITSYTMGDEAQFGDHYVLMIPMDLQEMPPDTYVLRDPGHAFMGDEVSIYINDEIITSPAPPYTIPDYMTYNGTLNNYTGGALVAVEMNISFTNNRPVADAQSVVTNENTPVDITLTGSDDDGDALTYTVVDDPVNGSLTGTAPDLTYTPDPDFSGSDSFTFKVNDGIADSSAATVDITVNAVLVIQAFCPVDLEVEDPNGFTFGIGGGTIPGAIYSEEDLNGDGDPDDQITIPAPPGGNYLITVIAEAGANPTDLYTLIVNYLGTPTTLALGVQVQNIPSSPYVFTTQASIAIQLFAGWNMISCPGDPAASTIAELGNPNILPYAYTWNPSIRGYELVYAIEFGSSYWFAAIGDTQLNMDYQPCASTTQSLTEGWNMIGSVCDDVTVESLVSAPVNAVLPYLYTWNPLSHRYELSFVIEPGNGYWAAAMQNAALTINSTPPSPSPPMRGQTAMAKPGWESVIEISIQNEQQQLVFGMHESASNGFDRLMDTVNPPLPALSVDSLKAGWVNNDGSPFPLLNRSLVRNSSRASWELSVELPEAGELQWRNLPEGYQCSLEYDGTEIQMRQEKSIHLPMGMHHLTLTLEAMKALPERTQLLANYPNPCNPETWIPYQLSDDSDVTIRVYSATGQLVRTLSLGHKSAGFYTKKEESAYWDGNNESGEQVASGIYFYLIEAGEFSAARKMVIMR